MSEHSPTPGEAKGVIVTGVIAPNPNEAWITDFATELVRLRPYLSSKLARVYAAEQWPRRHNQPGAQAASDFHANRSAPLRPPVPGQTE
jgi:hypothetical protein